MMFLQDYVLINNQLIRKDSIKDLPSHEEQLDVGEYVQAEVENKENQESVLDENATLALLEEYENHIEDFRNPKVKKKTVWHKIANLMKEKGFGNVDGAYLDQKFRNMKNTFKKIKDNNNKKTATGRGRVNWKYYDRFNQIFASDKTINITCTVSTATEQTIPNTDSDNISLSSSSRSNTSEQTPSTCRLDVFRKRQLALEEERLEELKCIRLEIIESNRINREKLEVLREYCNYIAKNK